MSAQTQTTSLQPQSSIAPPIAWTNARRVLVVRLRSIGDTVLATPALQVLRQFLPHARIDILLEDWVAPVLDGCEFVDNVITIEGRSNLRSRLRIARVLRRNAYDVAFNFHGGTTATFLTRASGAKHRIGYAEYRYNRLHNIKSPAASVVWAKADTHTVENQLALLRYANVPVNHVPPTRLAVTDEAKASLALKLANSASQFNQDAPQFDVNTRQLNASARQLNANAYGFAVIHPAAAFASKQWAAKNYARIAETLDERGLACIAVAAPHERNVIDELMESSRAPITALTNLLLPEITALLSQARIFVGNDSGIAHIAAAVRAPSVIVFGSSSIVRWSPWMNERAAVVREDMACAPCAGYSCALYDSPECINRVSIERVTDAIERVLNLR